jgi:thioredoxin 1
MPDHHNGNHDHAGRQDFNRAFAIQNNEVHETSIKQENYSMKANFLRWLIIFVSLLFTTHALAAQPVEIPVKDMVTMVDLGAGKCIPCKMMAPILEKLQKEYAGRAAIVFIDVWEDRSQSAKFGIRSIPTQIFFDKSGKEIYRHEGFLAEEGIVAKLKELGVAEPEKR